MEFREIYEPDVLGIIEHALRLAWYERHNYAQGWWEDAYSKLSDAVEAFEQRYPAYATELRESDDFTPEEPHE